MTLGIKIHTDVKVDQQPTVCLYNNYQVGIYLYSLYLYLIFFFLIDDEYLITHINKNCLILSRKISKLVFILIYVFFYCKKN